MNRTNSTYLIVTADDFGRSFAVNRAVEKAAREGLLTCASLMVTGEAVEDAVRIAKGCPRLQVGLHVTLTEGNPVSPKRTVPSLLKRDGSFKNSPARQGISLQFSKKVEMDMRTEVAAQFRAFSKTGLSFLHVDSHHHLHIHPRLFDIILENSRKYGLKTIRIPYEPWEISGPISKGHGLRNRLFRIIFSGLSSVCRKMARSSGIMSSDGVFGLYQTGEITEKWVLHLIDSLSGRPGIFELYTHPEDSPNSPGYHDLNALISPYVKERIREKGINLISYNIIHPSEVRERSG